MLRGVFRLEGIRRCVCVFTLVLGVVGVVYVILFLADGSADEFVLVKQCPHALVLVLDDTALSPPHLQV